MIRAVLIGTALLIGIVLIPLPLVHAGDNITAPGTLPAIDPMNATYWIEGVPFKLTHGRSERTIVPGSATRMTTAIIDRPVHGDLNGDGYPDAAVVLIHDPGGSGTFYYAAAAIYSDQGYKGTNAMLLGDRIIPKIIELTNYFINIEYADRLPAEPMSAKPSVDRQSFFVVNSDQLTRVQVNGKVERIMGGWVIVGHEVRSFQPCNQPRELWLMGDSPVYREVVRAYHQALPQPKPYQKLFMLLTGEMTQPPADGFGADYTAGFKATEVVHVRLQGKCTSIRFRFDLLNQ